MTTAEEFHAIGNSLFHWSAYDPACKCELSSTALLTTGGALVVIDPIPLAGPAWRELLAAGPLRAILLTNGNHVRDAARLREAYQVPIVTAPLTRRDITELKPDIALMESELLYGIAPVSIPGATAGETAFFCANAFVLIVGDAVINLHPEIGLEFLPAKYCVDAEQNRASLQKLNTFAFHTITFAHGSPVTSGARQKWQALLSS